MYLKDCSYEAPQGPRGEGNWQPQINLDLATTSNAIQGDLREVVLTVTVSAKQNDKTLFLVEVKQAGAFLMQNLGEEDAKRAIASICPGVLFPYARSMVSQLVSQGGFPQLLLPPVNFDALYLNAQAQSVTAQPQRRTDRALNAPIAVPGAVGTAPASAPIAVLGSGSWGTALAIQFARAGKPTRLWGRDAAQLRADAQRAPQPPLPARCAVSRRCCEVAESLDGALARRAPTCWSPCRAAAFARCSRISRRG